MSSPRVGVELPQVGDGAGDKLGREVSGGSPSPSECALGRRSALLVALGALAGCAPGEVPAPSPAGWAPGEGPPRHLVLISVDTLRADALTPYGAAADRTPYVARLAAEGAVFLDHLSPAATTLASHTSLMTGRWPHRHGVPRNGFPVPQEDLMLAEQLAGAGFMTAAFIGGLPLSARFDFDQGFAHFDEAFDIGTWGCRAPWALAVEQSQRAADGVTDAALAWLDGADPAGDRLFLFVHYFDPHAPYDAPGAYGEVYGGGADGSLDERLEVRAEWPEGGGRALSEALAARYAAEVTWTDHQLGRLLDGLEARGVLQEAAVLLTADHGEAFTEHWEVWNHGGSVYGEVVRSPLVVRLPDGRGRGAIAGLTSGVDVAPTALELLGVAPLPEADGVSFAAALRGEERPARPPAFSEATKPSKPEIEEGHAWPNAAKCQAVVEGDWKLISCPWRGTVELYNLAEDPGEQRDRLAGAPAPEDQARATALLEALAAWREGAAAPTTGFDEDPAVIEGLKSLGYLE
jgi:arylsulfatase A-like enzyme